MSMKAAVIGCGKRGMLHARGLKGIPGVELVAFADPVESLGKAAAAEFEGSESFTDTQTMLTTVKPEIAAICTRPQVRLEPLRQCIEASVKAIQCEKPMALSWNEARAIHELAEASDSLLAFTHQRRFRADFLKGKQLIDSGALGDVERVEGFCANLYDWGTHWFDMLFFLLGDPDAVSVLGAADFTDVYSVFDAPVEGGGMSRIRYENDVRGLLLTEGGKGQVAFIRVLGSEAYLEIRPHGQDGGVKLLGGGASGWQTISVSDVDAPLDHGQAVAASLAHLVSCLETGQAPLHGSRQALKATELIFATYASAKRDQRIDLPLAADESLALDQLFNCPA